MKLQHSSYRAYFARNDYAPVFYNWETGTFNVNAKGVPDKWYDLKDSSLPEFGYTTEHMARMIGELTGRKVRRLVAW